MDRSSWTPALGYFRAVGRALARPRSALRLDNKRAAASNGSDCSRRDRFAKENRSERSRGAAKSNWLPSNPISRAFFSIHVFALGALVTGTGGLSKAFSSRAAVETG